jgi:D-alanyl-D-alanine carboxypeptidase
MERLRQTLLWVGDADVARGLRSFPVAESDNQSPPIRTALRALRRARGDAAEEPDRQQVLAALDEVQDRFPASMIALMLAYVSVTDMAAADVCAEILDSDDRFIPPL